MEKRKRGRPPIAADRRLAAMDETIARTVGHLIYLGFPQRGKSGVYSIVASCAAEVLGRHIDGEETPRPLSASRIEKIYEEWRAKDFRRQWSRGSFTKDSLHDRVPFAPGGRSRKRLRELAMEMLGNNGELRKTVYETHVNPWTGEEVTRYAEDMIGHGDAELTPKAYGKYLMAPRIRKRGT